MLSVIITCENKLDERGGLIVQLLGLHSVLLPLLIEPSQGLLANEILISHKSKTFVLFCQQKDLTTHVI